MRRKTRPTLYPPHFVVILGLCLVAIVANATTPPTLGPKPADELLFKNSLTAFSYTVSGDPDPLLQWYREGKPLVGSNTGDLMIQSSMTDSGSYYLLARNISGAVKSPSVRLVVVDPDDSEVPVVKGHTARLSAPTLARTGVSFHWTKDGAEITPSSRITGINTPELVIAKTQDGDIGGYACAVTLGSQSLTGGVRYLLPVLSKPVIVTPLNLSTDPLSVAIFTSFDIEAEYYPDSFAVSGLPPGLVLDRKTGIVSGIPRAAGTFHLNITATNALGRSAAVPLDLIVNPLPDGSAGSMTGIWPPDDGINSGLGGRCSVTMQKNGAFTATLVLGLHTYRTSGLLGTDPSNPGMQVDAVILKGTGRDVITFSLSPDGYGGLACTLTSDFGNYISCSPRPVLPHTASKGRYTFASSVSTGAGSAPNLGWFTLGSTSAISGVMRLVDGQAVTLGGRLTSDHTAPVYATLYSGTGSLCGTIGTDGYEASAESTSVAGTLRWFKKPQTKFTRNLMAGLTVNFSPGGYGWPAGMMSAYARQHYGSLTWAGSTTSLTVSNGRGSLPRVYMEANGLGWKSFGINSATGFWSGTGTNRYFPDPYYTPNVHIDRGFRALGIMVRDSEGSVFCPGYVRMVDLADESLGTTLANSPVSFYTADYSASNESGILSVIGSYTSGSSYSGGLIITGAVLNTVGP